MGRARSEERTAPDAGDWMKALDHWFAPYRAALGHKGRQRWGPVYLAGLLGPGDRKSVQPMATRVAPRFLFVAHRSRSLASFNDSLALLALRFTRVVATNFPEDFHLQVDFYAGHTQLRMAFADADAFI